jgi:hypothetical protein
MGGWRDGWAVCEVWYKGGVKGPLLVKQKIKGKICFVICIAGKRIFFIYEVIVEQKIKKRPANHCYHEGSTHHIAGSRGSLRGDPLEMTRFCLTVYPI